MKRLTKYRPDEPHPDLWDHLRRKAPTTTYKVSPEQAQYMSDTLRARFAQVAHPRTGSKDTQESKHLRRAQIEGYTVQGYCLLCGGELYSQESVDRGMGLKCMKKALALGTVVRKPDGTLSLVKSPRKRK